MNALLIALPIALSAASRLHLSFALSSLDSPSNSRHAGRGTQAVVPRTWTEVHDTPTGRVSASGVTYKPWLGADDRERIFFSSIHG